VERRCDRLRPIGDSIAGRGLPHRDDAGKKSFTFDVSAESLSKTSPGKLKRVMAVTWKRPSG